LHYNKFGNEAAFYEKKSIREAARLNNGKNLREETK